MEKYREGNEDLIKKAEEKIFAKLDNERFQIVGWDASWNKFSEEDGYSWVKLEELVGGEEQGYTAVVKPCHGRVSYEYTPQMLTKINVHLNNLGLFASRKDGQLLITDPPIRDIRLCYFR